MELEDEVVKANHGGWRGDRGRVSRPAPRSSAVILPVQSMWAVDKKKMARKERANMRERSRFMSETARGAVRKLVPLQGSLSKSTRTQFLGRRARRSGRPSGSSRDGGGVARFSGRAQTFARTAPFVDWREGLIRSTHRRLLNDCGKHGLR